MSRVNPPPHIQIPKKFFDDPATRPYFQQIEFIIFQLWQRTGGGEDLVADGLQFVPGSQAQINAVREQIGSGDFLTGDTTGFTGDTTLIYGDLEEV